MIISFTLEEMQMAGACLSGISQARQSLKLNDVYTLGDALAIGVNSEDLVWTAYKKCGDCHELRTVSKAVFGRVCGTIEDVERVLAKQVSHLSARRERLVAIRASCAEFIRKLECT